MTKLTLNLPTGRRLHLTLVKGRVAPLLENDLVPAIHEAKKARSGSKISRFARTIIEGINLKKLLGSNLALAIIATSFVPTQAIANSDASVEPETVVISTQAPLTTEIAVQYPLRVVKVNQGYRLFHPGIDFEGLTGDAVRPFKAGKIQSVEYSRFLYGNSIIVDHGGNQTSLYAHLSKIMVKKGDIVTTLTKIGEVGSTGRSTGDHLHLEIRQNGLPVNPLTVLPKI